MSRSSAAQLSVSSLDRFGFTLFIAIAVHALIVLGLSFDSETARPASKTLEITLAQFRSDKAPVDADFIAQQNQQGSGQQQKKTLPTTREVAPFQNNQAAAVAPGLQPSPVQLISAPQLQPSNDSSAEQTSATDSVLSSDQTEQVTTQADSLQQVLNRQDQKSTATAPAATGMSSSLLARSLEIASLEAKLDTLRQEQAKAPEIRRLTSASTRESFDAQYLDSWRRKVEQVGNINYPEQARQKKLFGNLRLLVVIQPNGALERVEVLKSSGHKVLDDAARRIVRIAAPYEPFPAELRKQADRVEIIRTWKFERARVDINQ